MASNGYLPSQLTGPISGSYISAVQAIAHSEDSSIAYLHNLSIATANTVGTGNQELVGLGYLIGYPVPTVTVTSPTAFTLGDSAFFPFTNSLQGLGDNVSTGGRLTDVNAIPVNGSVSNDLYRKALGIVAKIKTNGYMSIAMIDQLAYTFSTNYTINMPGVSVNQFTLGDTAGFPVATTTIGFGSITGSTGGLLADAVSTSTGDITLLIYDNIGSTAASIIQNIANTFMTSPQLNVVYLGS